MANELLRILGGIAPTYSKWAGASEGEKKKARAAAEGYLEKADDLLKKLLTITNNPETIKDVIQDDPQLAKYPRAKDWILFQLGEVEPGPDPESMTGAERKRFYGREAGALGAMMPEIRRGGIAPEAREEMMGKLTPAYGAQGYPEQLWQPSGYEGWPQVAKKAWMPWTMGVAGAGAAPMTAASAAGARIAGEPIGEVPTNYNKFLQNIGTEFDALPQGEQDLAIYFAQGAAALTGLDVDLSTFEKKYPVMGQKEVLRDLGIEDMTAFDADTIKQLPPEEKMVMYWAVKRLFGLSDKTMAFLFYNWIMPPVEEGRYEPGRVPGRFTPYE